VESNYLPYCSHDQTFKNYNIKVKTVDYSTEQRLSLPGYWPNAVVLNLFSTTPPLKKCPLFQAPSYFKQSEKTNVFIGKFHDQTFHVVGHVRDRAPWKFTEAPLGGRAPPMKNHWPKALQSKPWSLYAWNMVAFFLSLGVSTSFHTKSTKTSMLPYAL